MSNSNSNPSAYAQKQIYETQRTSSLRRTRRRLVYASLCWMLLGLALLLTGCAHQSPVLCPQQQTIIPPALSEPTPSESYSSQWKKLAEEWRKKLTFTQTTP